MTAVMPLTTKAGSPVSLSCVLASKPSSGSPERRVEDHRDSKRGPGHRRLVAHGHLVADQSPQGLAGRRVRESAARGEHAVTARSASSTVPYKSTMWHRVAWDGAWESASWQVGLP
jgi:hypothetical protein